MRYFILILSVFILFGCVSTDNTSSEEKTGALYAGARASSYGIQPYPEPEEWATILETMNDYYEGSTPCVFWIIGTFSKMQNKGVCTLNFPSDGNTYDAINFASVIDKNVPYLDLFEEKGIKVFLQVESGSANMTDLIDIVLSRYKDYECVVGFGVDVEWYKIKGTDGYGTKIDDALAKAWDTQIKSYNKNYRLYLKHWDREWMPPTYRSDLIFVTDSQDFGTFEQLASEMITYWANYFYPNTVFYQIGYDLDKHWWDKFEVPPRDFGLKLGERTKQDYGVFWVDFTIRNVFSYK